MLVIQAFGIALVVVALVLLVNAGLIRLLSRPIDTRARARRVREQAPSLRRPIEFRPLPPAPAASSARLPDNESHDVERLTTRVRTLERELTAFAGAAGRLDGLEARLDTLHARVGAEA